MVSRQSLLVSRHRLDFLVAYSSTLDDFQYVVLKRTVLTALKKKNHLLSLPPAHIINSTFIHHHGLFHSLFQVHLLLFPAHLLLFPALGSFISTPTLLDVLGVSRGNLSFLSLLAQTFLRMLYRGILPQSHLTYGAFSLHSFCSFHGEVYTLLICNCLLFFIR